VIWQSAVTADHKGHGDVICRRVTSMMHIAKSTAYPHYQRIRTRTVATWRRSVATSTTSVQSSRTLVSRWNSYRLRP